MRTSTVRQIPYVGSGSSGPDTIYVVDFYENSIKIETREFVSKSVHYAESAARNWDAGIIKNDK
tara:strand:+ start:566 stop:757 length:192 start_codon:yes stop_codon:yes gene_type:complete